MSTRTERLGAADRVQGEFPFVSEPHRQVRIEQLPRNIGGCEVSDSGVGNSSSSGEDEREVRQYIGRGCLN